MQYQGMGCAGAASITADYGRCREDGCVGWHAAYRAYNESCAADTGCGSGGRGQGRETCGYRSYYA